MDLLEPVLWPPATGTEIGTADLIEVSSQEVGIRKEGERDLVRAGERDSALEGRREREAEQRLEGQREWRLGGQREWEGERGPKE